ncbi:MAG: glycosyltransferase family 2 protein [Pseudomonadota bacterium]|nr:glycosyltransferase family 2 protein [Pseudomonadota bacterium]
MPAVAVIMPVHNRAAEVRRAIDSVLAQDFADFELIVVDDGSTDATCEAVTAVGDPRVKLIRLGSNQGSNPARNRGIEAASAPLLAFLDSDDVYLPCKLGVVVGMFGERPGMDVLVDSFTKEFPADQRRAPAPRDNPVIDDTEAFAEALFGRRLWKATPAITVRRDAAMRAGLFDESLKRLQDFDFLIRLTRTARCAATDRVLWTKCWTAGAISDDLHNYVPATIALCRRHPAYAANPRYRVGLARDVSRHLARLLARGRVADALRDARLLGREFELLPLLAMLLSGAREMITRRAEKIAISRSPAVRIERHRAK